MLNDLVNDMKTFLTLNINCFTDRDV